MGFGPFFFDEGLARPVTSDELAVLLHPVVAGLGLTLLGTETTAEPSGGLLRLYIEAPDRPVTVDDCERVSREVSATLDVSDPMPGRYTLEVSSPGIDRPLFTPEQFSRFAGSEVRVSLRRPVAGQRRVHGRIRSVDGSRIVVGAEGGDFAFDIADVGRARLVPDYAALGMAGPRPARGRGHRRNR